MSDNIPLEIQLEIIKKAADVKSLVRFRSVSKPWKSFIDSPAFVAAYGARGTQPHSLLLRYRDNKVDPREVKYVSFVDDENDILTQQDFAPNVPDQVKELKSSTVIGSSCGLWCLYCHKTESTGTDMIVIWNPSIRKSIGIVVPYELQTPASFIDFGFGVCPSTYDPTIVVTSHRYLEKKGTVKWQVGIFTLSSKTWKMIPSSNTLNQSTIINLTTQVAIDRCIFWLAIDRDVIDGVSQYKNWILSFDLISHEFKEVHLPVSPRYFSISKLNESLVVSAYTDVVNKILYDVWMMGEEGGLMTSFTKLFTINTPDSSIRRLLGFRKSGEPIMEMIKKDEEFASALKVYEPCSEHTNDLGINGECGSFFICPYTESLLLIDHSDACIISNDY